MVKEFCFSCLAAIGILFTASSALAISIDFRDSQYAAYAGSNTAVFIVDGVTVTIQASNGLISWSAEDGLGIFGFGFDPYELENPETLLVSFSEPLNITELIFYDLYRESILYHTYDEMGAYKIDGGPVVNFTAVPGSPNGEVSLSLPSVLATSILFTAPGIIFANGGIEAHEYALGGINTDIPEPASLILLGLGLLGIAAARRKRY